MSVLAAKFIDAVDDEIYRIVDAHPPKVVAPKVKMDPRYVKGLKYREHRPSVEARVQFGFAYPSVGTVWAYWGQRMTAPDFFDHEVQREFYRDMGRAGKRE